MKKENIIKLYQTYQLIIFPAVVALSSLFLILFAIYPQAAKLIADQKVADELFGKSTLLATKVQALESYNESDLSQKVNVTLASLPTNKDFSNIFGVLEQLTSQSGFSINSISLGNTAGKVGNVNSYEVKLEMKGIKILLPVLLSNLEKSARLIRISSIDIAVDSASQVANISLAVQVLYDPPPQNFGTPDSPLPELSQQDEAIISSLVQTPQEVSTTSAVVSPRGKVNPFE